MEVTVQNFDEVLEKFPALLKNTQFISIDTEFTGLKVDGGSCYNYYDTLKEFYDVFRQNVETFLAIQYGVCLFDYDANKNAFNYHAFNFYVYPASSKKNFTCQVSCLRFLSEHGFDFNKLFRDGITYLTEDETAAKLEQLKARREKQATESPSIKVPKDQKNTIQAAMKRINDFIDGNDKEATLPRYNAFVRRLIYQTAKERFGEQVTLEFCKKKEVFRVLKGLSEEDLKKRQENKWKAEEQDILREVGFSKIVKMLVECGKPIIGHNMLLDLLFTIHQFLQPLPTNFDEFREMMHCLFPYLLDTKHIATASNVRSNVESSLQDVLESIHVDELLSVEPATSEVGYQKGEERPHQAAYDAYLAGLAFISMLAKMNKDNTENIYSNLKSSSLLKSYVNKLSIPRMHEIPCLDLEGEYFPPDRQNVFHITFPEVWKNNDILAHFKDYGFINIRWIDNTSAFIGIGSEFVKKMKQEIIKNNQSECKVMTYNDFRSNGVSGKSAGIEVGKTRKRISSEDLGDVVSQKKTCAFPIPAFE